MDSEGKEFKKKKDEIGCWRGGGYCEFFLREDELARWYPPPPQKKIFFFWKSEGEKIERERRKMKMDVGGGGGGHVYIFYGIAIFFERG